MTAQHPAPTQTVTPVQNMDALLRQRSKALARDQCALGGVSLYAQLVIGIALYLYDHVSTPSYLSILLTLPFLLLLSLISHWLARQADPQESVIAWALGRRAGKIIAIGFAAIFWLDAQIAAYALNAMVQNVLPDMSPLWSSLSVALIMAWTIGGGDQYALHRLTRFFRWIMLPVFLYCAITVLPKGNIGHLFPVLGYGSASIFQGSLWLCGCLAGACCPLVMPQAKQTMASLCQRRCTLLRPYLAALAAASLTALLSAYLLPIYALARPESLGWRMMVITHVSPSVAAWSLFLCMQMFLLLIALAAGVTRAAAQITWAVRRPQAKPFLILLLLLLQVPAAALPMIEVQEMFLAIAPWRGAAALALMLILLIGALIRKKIREAQKEATT